MYVLLLFRARSSTSGLTFLRSTVALVCPNVSLAVKLDWYEKSVTGQGEWDTGFDYLQGCGNQIFLASPNNLIFLGTPLDYLNRYLFICMELYKSLIFRWTQFSWQAPKQTCFFDHNHCHSTIQEPPKLAWVSLEANVKHIYFVWIDHQTWKNF